MLQTPTFAIIIPAYNEDCAIRQVIRDIRNQLKDYSADIIVVNDGSHDNTAKIAESENVLVISHIINSGSGAATATGLRYAALKGYDFAATIDADGQHRVIDLEAILKRLVNDDSPDLVIGSRLIDSTGMSVVKKYGNISLSLLTKVLFGIGVTDSQSGLRGFSRHAIDSITLRTQGYEFCSEMLWRAKQKKLYVTEVPIEAIYTEYSKGKGQSNWNAFNIIGTLVRHRVFELLNG